MSTALCSCAAPSIPVIDLATAPTWLQITTKPEVITPLVKSLATGANVLSAYDGRIHQGTRVFLYFVAVGERLDPVSLT